MKVGLVFDGTLIKTDGVAQYVLTLGGWLESQGHKVHYLVGETKHTDIKHVHSLSRNITVSFNQNKVSTPLPANKSAIRELLAKEQFDVLHIQMPYSPFMAARVVKAAHPNTAIVGTFHIAPASWMVNAGTQLLGVWLRSNLKRFDWFVSVSSVAQDFAKKTFGIQSDVIPNTAPLGHFFGAKPFKEYNDQKTIVFLGRLVERKGCQHLLAAIEKLRRDKKWPDNTKVVICGDGPLKLRLTQFVHESGLTDIVEFKGFISEADKPRYMASADVAIFPSTGGESFGIVLLEAMAAARGIVLAGNNPGYASVMHRHSTSLFDPRNTEALVQLLLSCLNDDSKRKEASTWQRKYAQTFTPDVVGAQIMEVYTRALHARRK